MAKKKQVGPKGPRKRGIGTKKGPGPIGKLLQGFKPSMVNNLPVENPPLWNVRLERRGRPPLISSGDELLEVAGEYFKWVMENPLYADKLVTFQGFATHEPEARKRLMSISAMSAFFGIAPATWHGWRKDRPELINSMNEVEAVIHDWNAEGAAADMLNAGFVARLMGLADKQEVTGKDGQPINPPAPAIDLSKFTDEELEAYRVVAAAAERNRG